MRYLLSIESNVLDQLMDLAQPGLVVRGLPERPMLSGEDFNAGELTVHLHDQQGSTDDGSIGGDRQNVTLYIDLFLRIDAMAAEGGYYQLMDAITSRLFGYRPSAAKSAIRFVSCGYVDQVEGWYMYKSRWSCVVGLVRPDEPTAPPILKAVGFTGNLENDGPDGPERFYSSDPGTGQQLSAIEFKQSE